MWWAALYQYQYHCYQYCSYCTTVVPQCVFCYFAASSSAVAARRASSSSARRPSTARGIYDLLYSTHSSSYYYCSQHRLSKRFQGWSSESPYTVSKSYIYSTQYRQEATLHEYRRSQPQYCCCCGGRCDGCCVSAASPPLATASATTVVQKLILPRCWGRCFGN